MPLVSVININMLTCSYNSEHDKLLFSFHYNNNGNCLDMRRLRSKTFVFVLCKLRPDNNLV